MFVNAGGFVFDFISRSSNPINVSKNNISYSFAPTNNLKQSKALSEIVVLSLHLESNVDARKCKTVWSVAGADRYC